MVGIAGFAGVYAIASLFFGPGVRDSSESIANGYEFVDSGGYEKVIVYKGMERPNEIVIDARVDAFRLEGNSVLVARRPRNVVVKDQVATARLSGECEYWTIDTGTHSIVQTPDSRGLRCDLTGDRVSPQ